MKTVPLTELASVIRSKNAGPYELTLDIMFKREEDYLYVKKIQFFNSDIVAHIYGISPQDIINIIYFDPAWAIKISLIRPVVSGAIGETDVYGAQQHAPLLYIQIPIKENFL
ncbi:MAG: DUF4387 domain-containing protein [Syntrophaceae bacterium]